MRRQTLLVTALTSALGVAATNEKALPAGTFNSELGRLTLAADGKFRLERDGSLLVNGRYRVKDDQVTLEDDGGPFACPADVAGRYRWTYDGKRLVLAVVDDTCDGRSMGVARSWATEQAMPEK